MQKIAVIVPLLLFGILTYAQNVANAKNYLSSNKLIEAKNEIDKVITASQDQRNPEAFYIKAKIYSALALDPQLKKQFPAARIDAFNALKKYTETDDRMLIALQIDGYKPVNEIYTGFYQSAANAFNNKDYSTAFTDFTNAISVSKFMNEKGWIKMELDTNSVLYAGVSAEKLSRFDDAVTYYGQLVKGKAKGEGFIEIYKWTANHFYEKKDYNEASEYIKIGREVYPNDPFWVSLELDLARASGNNDQLFTKYEEVIAKNPANHLFMYNYGVELYHYAYNVDPSRRPANSEELIKKVQQNIANAIRIQPAYGRAQLFAGQILYNNGVDILKSDKTKALAYFDQAIPYLVQAEKIYTAKTNLGPEEKDDLKEAYDLLMTIYDQKNMKDKVTEYSNKFSKLSN